MLLFDKERGQDMQGKKILTDIVGIFGMTALILIRIEKRSFLLRVLLACLYLIASIYYAIQVYKTKREENSHTIGTCYKKLHFVIWISYFTILAMVMG